MLQDPFFIQPTDFAPGDRCKIMDCWEGSDLHRIQSPDDPWFDTAFSLLWDHFSPACEMEHRAVIEHRLRHRQNPVTTDDAHTFYEMALVVADGKPAAVRDHTVILPENPEHAGAIVHLSHNLVLPPWRRSGLAGWMRAFPAASASEILEKSGRSGSVVMVAEMEPMDIAVAARVARLTAYESAGFAKVDPAELEFWQPDFRSNEEIAASGFQPIPLHLVLRFCDVDHPTHVQGSQILEIIDALYTMYSRELSQENVDHARSKVSPPEPEHLLPLIPPTRESSPIACA